jgi:hypothetical protein
VNKYILIFRKIKKKQKMEKKKIEDEKLIELKNKIKEFFNYEKQQELYNDIYNIYISEKNIKLLIEYDFINSLILILKQGTNKNLFFPLILSLLITISVHSDSLEIFRKNDLISFCIQCLNTQFKNFFNTILTQEDVIIGYKKLILNLIYNMTNLSEENSKNFRELGGINLVVKNLKQIFSETEKKIFNEKEKKKIFDLIKLRSERNFSIANLKDDEKKIANDLKMIEYFIGILWNITGNEYNKILIKETEVLKDIIRFAD